MAEHVIKERVVGQLLVMQSFIESLPSEESVFRFLCKGLMNVPGVDATGICVQQQLISTDTEIPFAPEICTYICTDTGTYSGRPDPSLLVVPIRTANITFASLLLRIADQNAFTPHHPLIANLCNSVGFLLNDRRVKQMLENHERLLTQAVEQRTHSLKLEIDERIRVENSLRKLTEAVEQSPVAVIISDHMGKIEYASPAVSTSVGLTPQEVSTLNLLTLLTDKLHQERAEAAWEQVKSGANWNGVAQGYRRNDSTYWEEIVLAPVRSVDKEITSFVALIHDITAQREAEQRADFLAHHDALTLLPNLALSKDRMQQAIARADRDMCRVALIFLDIDNFKKINDSLGHSTGDHLLQTVAIRLRDCIGETDTLSRESGDEFTIVLPDFLDIEKSTAVITKIQNQMTLPFQIDGEELYVSVSMGIALYPDDGGDFDALFKCADAAMYRAKEAGRNTYRFFTSQMNIEANLYLRLRNDLNRALLRSEFVLHYQPQISLSSGKIIGVEALIRWHHPELGLLSPGGFIQVAEESGLILQIGDWVLQEACRQGVEWQKMGLENLVVAINLSPIQFRQGNLIQNISAALAQTGLPHDLLEVEFTESALISETHIVPSLKSLGIKVSIDDFGTGYSNLAYLKQFQVDKIKIDQSFVRDIAHNQNDASIVRAIVQMAKSLGITTIAEGVETKEALNVLLNNGCNEIQGYLVAKPMLPNEIVSFIANWNPAEYALA